MGVAILCVLLVQQYLKKYLQIDLDKIDVAPYFKAVNKHLKSLRYKKCPTIVKNTGNSSLVLINSGANKATVMATLRQITGIDYNNAKAIVDSVPARFMVKVSEKEAELTKKALEFVGAELEIE